MKNLLTILIFLFAIPYSDVFAQHVDGKPGPVKMDGGYSIKGNNVTAIDKTTLSTKNTSIASSYAVRAGIKDSLVSPKARITALEALVLTGTGNPTGVVSAPIGTLYLRLNGVPDSTLWVKQSGTGNTGWKNK